MTRSIWQRLWWISPKEKTFDVIDSIKTFNKTTRHTGGRLRRSTYPWKKTRETKNGLKRKKVLIIIDFSRTHFRFRLLLRTPASQRQKKKFKWPCNERHFPIITKRQLGLTTRAGSNFGNRKSNFGNFIRRWARLWSETISERIVLAALRGGWASMEASYCGWQKGLRHLKARNCVCEKWLKFNYF